MTVAALPLRVARTAWRNTHGISYRREPKLEAPISQPCTYAQLESAAYASWCTRLEIPVLHHRKMWEWCFILSALDSADMLRPGRVGLGFGVGREPITAHAASRGCRIVATDSPASASGADEWSSTGQHAEQLLDINYGDLCPQEEFERNVTFRPVDMRSIPPDLTGFDFNWSSCAMEHLGDLEAGFAFFEQQLSCLRSGGVGVHTTEFNVDPTGSTLADGHTVLYQRGHLEELTRRIRRQGHRMQITFALGHAPQDLHVDLKPYSSVHIRTETNGFIHTSFGLIVRKA